MEKRGWLMRIFFSLLLVGVGTLLLLSNLQILPWDVTGMQWFWLLVFGGGGLAFLAVFASGPRENWWAVIPSFTLIGLSILISEIIPPEMGDLGGAVFLGMIGLSFWVIFAVHRAFWWAVIPGGVLLTLTVVILTSELLGGAAGGAFFFIGLGLTFLLVYLLPAEHGRNLWAIWPAAATGILGLLILVGAGEIGRFFWPIAFILGGGYLVFRALTPRHS